MTRLIYSRETIERTERLVDILELRKDWNAGVFNDCSYEHMLPVFESAYRHCVKPLTRPGEENDRRRLERSIYEVFGKATTISRDRISAHTRMMILVADYVALGHRLVYPISDWSKEELFAEYNTSYHWSSVWTAISTGATVADVSKSIAEVVAKILAAATILRVAGTAGIAITVAGATAAFLAARHFTREREKIREEVQRRIDEGELTKNEWDEYDLKIMRKYNE